MPQPDGPSTAMKAPSSIARSMRSTAVAPVQLLRTFLSSIQAHHPVRVLDEHGAHEDVLLPCPYEREYRHRDQSDPHVRQDDHPERLPPGRAVGHRAHLDVPGHGVEEALHHENVERQLDRRQHQHHAENRVEQPHPVQDQEDRDDERHRRKSVQHQHALEKGFATAEGEARDVVARERSHRQDDHGLRSGKRKRIAKRDPYRGELPARGRGSESLC